MKNDAPPRRIEYMPLDELLRAPRNPKGHAPAAIKASVETWGLIEPQVLDERTGALISGHGRLDEYEGRQQVASEPPQGIVVDPDGRWLVPVVRGWASKDDDDATAAGIALNRIGEVGGWVSVELLDELDKLRDTDLWGATGFDDDDLDNLVAELQDPDLGLVTFTNQNAERGYGQDQIEPSYDERAVNYRNKQVRSMVFDYPLADYERIVEVAGRARTAFKVESNAELFERLLAAWEEAQ